MTSRYRQMRCVVLGLAISLGGCVYSLESVITGSTAAFDTRLLGVWEEVGGTDGAVVTRFSQNGYAIEYMTNDTVRVYEARLGRLGDLMILDVLVPPHDELAKPPGETPIARHLAFVLDIGENEMRVALIDADSLVAAIRAGRIQLDAHARVASCPRCSASDLILEGTTQELRSALGPYLASPRALEPPTIFRRATAARKAAHATHADSSSI